MGKVLKFVRLDLITIKPYLPQLLLVFAMGLCTAFLGSTSGAGMMFMLASIAAGYPFAVGEKCGIDTLYTVLSISRRSVVLGRYVLALLVYLSLGLLLLLIALARPPANPEAQAGSLAGIIAVFVIFSVMQMIQFPILFKIGYTKARLLVVLPMAGFGAAVSLFSVLSGSFGISEEAASGLFAWARGHPPAVLAAGIALWLALAFASFKISVLVYEKRDF